jgi:Methyltransferase FkbM domain
VLPDWYDGIGSFSKESVLGHAVHIPDVEERLVCQDVATLTFDSLCRKHGLGRVDLVVIDTEGYDWEVVRTIDLDAWRPRLIVYEHYHLARADRAACAEHVRRAGYRTLEEGFDTFCLRAGADARLERLWSRLRPAVAGVSVHDEAR